MKPQYIVIISSSYKGFIQERAVFGPFDSVENIENWLKDRYNNWRYTIDIHPIIDPHNTVY